MDAATPRIGIIVATTRDVRFSRRAAEWLLSIGSGEQDLGFDIVDLRDYPMPFFNEAMKSLFVPSKDPSALAWQAAVDRFDGFVCVMPEYNHGIPAVLKNALDYAYTEWNRKPLACFGYGGLGAARGIEHLRGVAVELQMACVRTAVHFAGADFIAVHKGELSFDDFPYLADSARAMIKDLAWWAAVLRDGRARHSTAS